jgi:hypothetical protein
MKLKLTIIITILLSIDNAICQSQPSSKDDLINSIFSNKSYEFLLPVFDSSLYIIRQDYTLIDGAGNEYGRNKDAFFGKKYGLGVVTDSGIYTTTDILVPWEDDKNFNKFKNNDSLKPHLSKIFYKRLNDKTFSPMETGQSKKIVDSSLIIFRAPDSLPYIADAINLKDTTGWIVLAKSREDPGMTDSFLLNLSIIRPVFSEDSTGKMYIRNLAAKDNFIGGIFYTSHISLGKILFSASGILKKDGNGWYIKTFRTGAPEIKSDRNILNPVKKETKDKANKIDKHKT